MPFPRDIKWCPKECPPVDGGGVGIGFPPFPRGSGRSDLNFLIEKGGILCSGTAIVVTGETISHPCPRPLFFQSAFKRN